MSGTGPVREEPAAGGGQRAAASSDGGARAATGALLRYSAGSLGMGVWITVPGMLLLYFMTDTLGVSPALAGVTLLIPKIVDAVAHPALGTWSDREARRHGHRRRMLTLGLTLAVALVALFTVPSGLTGLGAALWVGVAYTAGNLLFACFQVPYVTTPSELRIGYHERTRVFMFRMAALTVGLLATGVAAPALVASGERDAYSRAAMILSVFMVVTGLVAVRGVRLLTEECGTRPPPESGHSVLADVRTALRDRDFRPLLLAYLVTGTTTHLFLAAVPYYTAYVLGNEKLTSVLMGAFLGPAIVVGPLWQALSRRHGKQRALMTAQTLFLAGCLGLWPAGGLGTPATVVVAVLLGVAFAGLQLLAFSMLSDAVAAAEARGSTRAGAYSGIWTATDATGTALGPYLYALALAAGGFVSTTGGTVAQPQRALDLLLLGFTALPAALMALALLFQSRCRLDERGRPGATA
ncbi:MFS transporter [Streptomyces sp. UH6]|uniref:MFS transporter n=1 Tax=Streptomyces sp. UH6 TaxID=2748379 RepID=UPI0015D4BDF2|nr:MFS transporter [Streptomyces sp. UH6]NYV76419.1 MFS transporter [Streptomyces sp. UH6]